MRSGASNFIVVGVICCLIGACREKGSAVSSPGPEIVREVSITGFDKEGEPSVRLMSDGSLEVVVEFMPPSWASEEWRSDLGPFATFDQQMSKAIGLPVKWDDREVFFVQNPASDTIERLSTFFLTYRIKWPDARLPGQ